MKVKVCGMRQFENIQEITQLPIDLMGFIFYPKSKRFVGEDFDPKILYSIPETIQKVGVFVNEDLETVFEKYQKYNLDFVQLHGKESPEFCQKLKQQNLEIIKVFSIGTVFDFSILEAYKPHCDYFLFDTQTPDYGGSGQKFSWEILKKYDNEIPLFLSGGIGQDDASAIQELDFLNIEVIDINSRFELEPALKNPKWIEKFINDLKLS